MSFKTATHSQYNCNTPTVGVGMWTEEEHARFLEGVKLFSDGPWKRVAAYVGTRNVRQTMTHAQKYRLKAARRLREAQRKQAAARHGLQNTCRSIAVTVDSPHARRSLQCPSGGGLGLGSCSKMRLPCLCIEKDCPHVDDSSKIYMSIADAIEILDSKTSSYADSPVSTDDNLDNTWLDASKYLSFGMLGNDDLVPLDTAAGDSREFPTLEDCASELLELLF